MLQNEAFRRRWLMRFELTCALIFFGCAGGMDDRTPPRPMDSQPAPPGPSSTARSRCPIDATTGDVACAHESTTIGGRLVVYQTPLGAPPEFGWPVVVMLQGSLFGPDLMWAAKASDALAKYAMPQTLAIKALLDAGYAVITPEADANALAWDTNIPPWDFDWMPAPDNRFMLELFSAMDGGDLGPFD